MFIFKKFLVFFIITLFLLLHTSLSFASSDSLFVWSSENTGTVSTSGAIDSKTENFLNLTCGSGILIEAKTRSNSLPT